MTPSVSTSSEKHIDWIQGFCENPQPLDRVRAIAEVKGISKSGLRELRFAAHLVSITAEAPSGSRVTFWWSPPWNKQRREEIVSEEPVKIVFPDRPKPPISFDTMRLSEKANP